MSSSFYFFGERERKEGRRKGRNEGREGKRKKEKVFYIGESKIRE